jgi:hypothetical protein
MMNDLAMYSLHPIDTKDYDIKQAEQMLQGKLCPCVQKRDAG